MLPRLSGVEGPTAAIKGEGPDPPLRPAPAVRTAAVTGEGPDRAVNHQASVVEARAVALRAAPLLHRVRARRLVALRGTARLRRIAPAAMGALMRSLARALAAAAGRTRWSRRRTARRVPSRV